MTTGAAAARDDVIASGRGRASLPGPPQSDADYKRAFTRLCHLVPLTEGKGDEALDGVVVTALALNDGPVRGIQGVVEVTDAFFGVTLDEPRVEASIDRLVAVGKVRRSSDRIHPSPEATADVLERVDAGRAVEDRVRNDWVASTEATATGLDGSLLWRCLSGYMASVFRTHGILAVELLDPTVESSESDATAAEVALVDALGVVPAHAVAATRTAIEAFFTRPSAERTRYIAQMLDATFTLFALTLDETVAGLVLAELQPVDLFLDTNVVFGLLDLDTDARGQAAKEVVRFIRANGLPVTLYYHEETLAEIERTVGGFGARLRSRSSWPQDLSRAALDRRVLGELRGVEKRYHELNADTPISPSDFLSKYQHVQRLLQDWGVHLFRSSGINRYTTEHKGSLIAEYIEYVKARRPNEPKSYESASHDITVWLEVQQRGRPAPNSLKTGALFLTNDHLFRGFVSHRESRKAPQAVLPPQLLQVLRPFGSRSVSDDERFVATLCLPEFRTAHTGYADTQRKVMGFLAQYNDVNTETAVKILADEVLMRRVRNLDAETEDFKVAIESQVLQDNDELVRRNEAAVTKLVKARRDAEQAKRERDEAVADRDRSTGDLEDKLAAALRQVGEVQNMARATVEARTQQRSNLEVKAGRDARLWAAAATAPLALGAAVVAGFGAVGTGLFDAGAVGALFGALGALGAAVAAWFGLNEPRRTLRKRLERRFLRTYLARIGETP